ncbi:MAG: aminopeptidase P family protein [Pseudomonadota bacterium]
MNEAPAALARLRAAMVEAGITACIVTNFDPHHSEYSGVHWLAREYFSGFTGSAGDLLVLADGGGLWTDGRYSIQAAEQLRGTDIAVFMTRVEGLPSLADHLASVLGAGDTVAVAGHTVNVAMYQALEAASAQAGFAVRTDLDLPDQVWADRPPRADAKALDYPLEFAGASTADKLGDLRSDLAAARRDAIVISALPDVCWLLNVRGGDVPFCPLLEGFLYVDRARAVFCVDLQKIDGALRARLEGEGVALAGYDEISALVSDATGALSLCPQSTSAALYRSVPQGVDVTLAPPPTEVRKACKNPVELAAFREALRHDGVAMVRFARWLEAQVPTGTVTERSAEAHLRALRATQPHFLEESFHTIAAYGAHGALMHYAATAETDVTVGTDTLFLVDSGGQYLGGTTDITRTFAFGELSELERLDYTRVLQAVIRLTQTRFRKGARGCNLDIMARGVLWQHGIDYECGTGHGVGQCLVVHEGPQNFSQRLVDAPLVPGMSITNEPGIYREGRHGVRIENIMAVVEAEETEFGVFYGFETLTLAPIQTAPLVVSALSDDELSWLNGYHVRVYESLASLLDGEEQRWLQRACAQLQRSA